MTEINEQGSHFSGDTKSHVFSRLFAGKTNEIPGQFGFESVCTFVMRYGKDINDFFCECHLEK